MEGLTTFFADHVALERSTKMNLDGFILLRWSVVIFKWGWLGSRIC